MPKYILKNLIIIYVNKGSKYDKVCHCMSYLIKYKCYGFPFHYMDMDGNSKNARASPKLWVKIQVMKDLLRLQTAHLL